MKFSITNKDLGGHAIGPNGLPIVCIECSPSPLDYATATQFKVGKIGVEQAESKYKPNMDIAMCPKCNKQIAY